nr:MAG TPA: hypothetical protein [Caudoviricetes sp.]
MSFIYGFRTPFFMIRKYTNSFIMSDYNFIFTIFNKLPSPSRNKWLENIRYRLKF